MTTHCVNSSVRVEEHKDRLCDKLCPTWTQWPVAAAVGQEDTEPSKEGRSRRECGPLQGPNRQNPKHTGAKLLGKVNPTPNTGPPAVALTEALTAKNCF